MGRSWLQGARTVRWAPNTHTHTNTLTLTQTHCGFYVIYCFIVGLFSVDLLVGSSDGYTDREDFDRTLQVDHLALLGTSPSVSTEPVLPLF